MIVKWFLLLIGCLLCWYSFKKMFGDEIFDGGILESGGDRVLGV